MEGRAYDQAKDCRAKATDGCSGGWGRSAVLHVKCYLICLSKRLLAIEFFFLSKLLDTLLRAWEVQLQGRTKRALAGEGGRL